MVAFFYGKKPSKNLLHNIYKYDTMLTKLGIK